MESPGNNRLLTLISGFQWDKVLERIESNPEDVSQVTIQQGNATANGNGNALIACLNIGTTLGRLPPLHVIKKMIKIEPGVICSFGSNEGESALHILFGRRSRLVSTGTNIGNVNVNVAHIKALAILFIDKDPSCLTLINSHEWLPLHSLFTHKDKLIQPNFIRRVLQPYPQFLVQENRGGITPLQMFWDRCALNNEGDCILHLASIVDYYDGNENEYNGRTGIADEEYMGISESVLLWECLLIMIHCWDGYVHRNMHMNQIEKNSEFGIHVFRPLHALATWPMLSTVEMIDVALHIHKRDIQTLDTHGNLPLHWACTSTGMTLTNSNEVFSIPMPAAIGTCDHHRGYIVKALLEKDPSAASVVNSFGKYPLFLAIISQLGWACGMEELLKAYPDALKEIDMEYHAYPFMLMASVSYDKHEGKQDISIPTPVGGDRSQCIDNLLCLYMFIRTCPDPVCGMHGMSV